MHKILLKNVNAVLPDRVLDHACVLVQGCRIQEVTDQDLTDRYPEAQIVDGEGGYLLPGFIDIHSDNIETVIQPRPQSMIDFELAMREQEKQLVNQGITTMYHSLSIVDVGPDQGAARAQIRHPDNVRKLVGLIRTFHEGDHIIRHRFHCRYDITNTSGYPMLLDLINSQDMQLLSFMDHTPGQGQYRDLELFKKKFMSGKQTDEEKDRYLQERMSRLQLTAEQITKAADLAHEAGIPIASHDDDTLDKIDYVMDTLHARICEFPVELEVAQEAHRRGMSVVVGATNVLMGRSHSNNLSAVEAIQAGCADILVSDYFPASILHAVFQLAERKLLTLPEAVNMATYNPAKALHIDDKVGSIQPGRCADLILVNHKGSVPVLMAAYINGEEVTRLHYRNDYVDGNGVCYD